MEQSMELELPEGLMEELLGDEEEDDENAAEQAEEALPVPAYQATLDSRVSLSITVTREAYDAYHNIVNAPYLSIDVNAIVERALMDAWTKMLLLQPASDSRSSKQPMMSDLRRGRARPSKLCKYCHTTDPERFYSYVNTICKKCYSARQCESKKAKRMTKAKAKAKTASPLPQQKRVNQMITPSKTFPSAQRVELKYPGSDLVERCAAEIKAAGPKGIFQRTLRDLVGLDRNTCKLAVHELVADGRVIRTGEQSANGSPKLMWKTFSPIDSQIRKLDSVHPRQAASHKHKWYKSYRGT